MALIGNRQNFLIFNFLYEKFNMILIFLILLIVVLLTVQQVYIRYSSITLYKMPGPPTLPFFGNALMLNDSFEGLWKTTRQCLNEYYPTVCLWIFSKPIVLMRHPDDIQVLLKSKSNIDKADLFYRGLRKLQNDGIIISGGEKWHVRRKMMNQAFLRSTLKSTVESANKYAELLIQQMLRWKDESIQNILPLTMKFSLDIICDSALGYDLHTVGAPYEEEFRKAFEDTINIVTYRCSRPFIKDWMLKFLPVGRKLQRQRTIIKAFTTRVLENRRSYHKSKNINLLSENFLKDGQNNANLEDVEDKLLKELNVLDILLIYNAKGLIDDEGVFEEIETLIGAGFDSTGLAIAFTLLLLAENEKEQDLVRREVIDVMKKSGNKLTNSELNNLQYLDRCIKETLRLFPSGPMIGRNLAEDTKFSKYVIPRNTDVFMNLYDLHRDPNFWSEPNKFNPDRFLPEFSKNRHSYAYVPFSSGLRGCIGQKHAVTEIKSITAHILRNFYLKPVDFTHNVSFDMHITLKPSTDKLRIHFIKILPDN